MAIKFTRLTRPAIRALEVGAAIMEHGIKAERLTSADIRYSVNIMVDGKRVHRVIGRESEGVTRYQAEQYIEQSRTDARHGRLSLPSNRKLHRGFAEPADDYVKMLEQGDGKNLGNKRRHLKLYLKPYFGKQRLDAITDFAVKQYAKKRREAGASEGTINRELATLSHLFSTAVRAKWIGRDARPVIEKKAEPRKPMVALNPAEASALLAAAAADHDADVYVFVAAGLNAAMRHSEILAVRYSDVDFDRRVIAIPEAKAGDREQPITPQLATILAERRATSSDPVGYVFPPKNKTRAQRPHRLDMSDGFRRAVKAASLDPKRVTPHTMRRTAITRLIMAGVPLPTIQTISGHKTLSMLLRYFHLYGTHMHDAAGQLEVAVHESGDATKPAAPDTVTHELHTPRAAA